VLHLRGNITDYYPDISTDDSYFEKELAREKAGKH
jgi:hypothetical protein